VGICCGSTGKMREPIECGNMVNNRRSNPHEAYSDSKFCNRTSLQYLSQLEYKQAVPEAATICPHPCKLTFNLLTLKVVSESRETWASSVPILVFPGFSC